MYILFEHVDPQGKSPVRFRALGLGSYLRVLGGLLLAFFLKLCFGLHGLGVSVACPGSISAHKASEVEAWGSRPEGRGGARYQQKARYLLPG